MKKNILLLLAFLFYSTISVIGQAGEVKRISLDQEHGEGSIINLFSQGLVIQTSDSKQCELMFYDENLKKDGSTKIIFEGKREYISNYYYDTLLKKIMVFHNAKKVSHLTMVGLDKKKKSITLVPPKKYAKIDPNFVKIDKSIYTIIISKGKTLLGSVELSNGNISLIELPTEWKARTILKLSRVNDKHLAVFYLDKSVKNKKFKNIAFIDDEGNVAVDKLVTNDEEDFPIEEYSLTDLGGGQIAIAGTYSSTVTTSYSIGLFLAKIDDLKLSYIKYFDYNSIKNFYNFMSEKSKEKAEKKAAKNAKKGKSTKYLAVTHPVINVDGKLIVTAEFYYPTYRTESYTTYVNGKPTTSYRTVFDGFQYTHTMVLGISEEGEKEYEHCIPFYLDHKPWYPTQKLKRRISNEEIKYSYISSNKIYSFSIANGDLKDYDPKTLVEVDEDKKLKSTFSSIDSWYDNYFYAKTGQTTKEKGKLIGGKETKYYLIKYNIE
jgi:hypothetical protein